eukprot:1499760-Pyramimonas_sp.AAC.3
MQMTLRSLCASRGRLRRKLRHLVDHGGGLHQVSLSGKAIVIKPRLANTLGEKQMRGLKGWLYRPKSSVRYGRCPPAINTATPYLIL